MLTPDNIRSKRFEKGMSGYRTEEVQLFLNEAADNFKSLLENNADMDRKLEILAEQVERYRDDEESLRTALIGAQKLGDSVVRDAKRKAEAIIAQATRKAEEILADAQASIERENMALSKMQMEVARFKGQILTLYKHHIELIQEIPYDEGDLPDAQDGADIHFVANIGEKVEITQEDPEGEEAFDFSFENVSDDLDGTRVFDVEEIPRRKSASRFGTLRFGDEYNLTRKE
ncbi:MAG: DivIVA domain-containing protein [Oscillospiraceae bacterium]|jgi:cell division initiation protein|nr:DivIVA domain-containing protein [Oscillospiraceae bacterium]